MLIFDVRVIQVPIIVLILIILLVVVVNIIFLILVFRWCEPAEPWTCLRSCLRTPEVIKHLLPLILRLGLLSTSC
jgi:hypothetical protein